MYWQLKDSDYPGRPTLVKIKKINAITVSKRDKSKLKLHLSCGKEFSTDEESFDKPCLIDLESMLKSNAEAAGTMGIMERT